MVCLFFSVLKILRWGSERPTDLAKVMRLVGGHDWHGGAASFNVPKVTVFIIIRSTLFYVWEYFPQNFR